MEAKLYSKDIYVNQELGYTLKIHYGFSKDCELHYHNYFEFFLTMSEGTVQLINGETQHIPPHALVFIRDRDVHGYTKEGKFSFINLAFNSSVVECLKEYFGDSMDALIDKEMPPTVILSDNDYHHIMKRLDSLMSLDVHEIKRKNTRMKLIITELISFFLEEDTSDLDNLAPHWLQNLMTILKEPEYFGKRLTDMSTITGKSTEHISRSFKKYLGITASEYQNEQRLIYAANLLINTNLSIIDICFESGFQNLSYFYRRFKKRFSESPQSFRSRSASALPV